MESVKNTLSSFNVFSNKQDTESSKQPTESTTSFFNYKVFIGMIVSIGLVYFLREYIYTFYQTHVSDSVKRFFGETMLKMNLSPNGDFVSTYVPDLSSFGKMVGIGGSAPNLMEEVELDNL